MYLHLLILILLISSFAHSTTRKRYILYDVNPGEGFNLRRDVFMRVAVFVKKLNLENRGDYILVLPPWGRLYHWQSRELGPQTKIKWSQFFDVSSINRYVPVIELEDFLGFSGSHIIDMVYYLQGYREGWKDGYYEEKWDFRDCIEEPRYILDEEEDLYHGYFWEYDDMRARDFKCVSVQGSTKVIKDLVFHNQSLNSIMLDRAENLLHDWFGDAEYWSIRRSMRFAKHLVKIADEFRKFNLDSTDSKDGTVMAPKWEDYKPERKSKKGGDYLCVHLRRKDYVRSRGNSIPSIKGAAEQILKKLEERKLSKVFVATDAPIKEFEEFKSKFPESIDVLKFQPSETVKKKYKDGGVAIIEQSICSHSKYFIGSYESTFTFRIQEEREIMGFEVKDTFDILCPDGSFDCSKGSIWKIVYPEKKKKKKTEKDEL